MKILYIVRGLPGSGKSTLAPFLTPYHCEADMYFIKDGEYRYIPEKIQDAHQWCKNEVEDYMSQNKYQIAVANTFTREWEMKPYYELAEKYGYTVIEIVVKSNFKSIHNVPDEVIEKMKNRFEFNL